MHLGAFLAAGVNRMIDASEVWLELMRSDRVRASEPFWARAASAGQGAMKI
ncbi:hypothetical protein J7E70_31075 [Variovorax paradoxus]|nr:hypothetical protein [Variovorax paradoxus]MBT2304862.1 hypothetical protein [Variovorax paradoxus]